MKADRSSKPWMPRVENRGLAADRRTVGLVKGSYNEQRFHQALGHRAPMRVWHEAMAVATVAREAVEMMDNAAALTTSPATKS